MTGTLPRRDSTPGRARTAPATRWTERRIARLAEEATGRTPAASSPAATVRVAGNVARVDLDLVVDHGAHLPTVAEAVRRRIADQVEACTGLTVESVTVTVVDLRLPAEHTGTAGDRTARPAAGG
ncbi:Asp23/Gls24 family envelope stress response protein [Micromonospora sp. HK10]|uniref:Asp23/Gls24 family envelope stress response protein n=1 Tax=Micromonospora sp. HK10 TaxID=1538294 RepID=UPI000695C351|nr:Asp23/Gls24 family envelope stress response protein [Micromonospora sp. HK10]